MIVCVCRAVSDRQIRTLADAGAESMAELRLACGIGECCGKCARQVRELLSERRAVGAVQDASRVMNVC